eukprot:403375368
MDLFDDIVLFRQSYASVWTSLKSFETNQVNEDLDQAVYHMAKALSLYKVLSESEIIQEADKQKFVSLRSELSEKLKQQMLMAINDKDEDEIERYAQLFKTIEEQGEGMKHYSHYLMNDKIQKDIDIIIQDMFQNTVVTIPTHDQDQQQQLVSDSYGEIQRILVDCMENYASSIIQLFDHESLIEFIKNIDKIAKEKATQVIQHFINQSKLENEDQEIQLDQICEEIIRFSQYYQSYVIYIMQLIMKSTSGSPMKAKSQPLNQSKAIGSNNLVKQIQRQIQFHLMDELVNNYIILEKFYLKNSLNKALDTDNQEYVKIVQKSFNSDKFESSQDIMEFVDEFCYILDTCSKRAVQSFNIVNACAIINMINQLLNDDIKLAFSNRVEIFLGKTSSKKFKPIHQVQHLQLVKDIAQLHPLTQNSNQKKPLNLANSLFIGLMNRIQQLSKNMAQLQTQLKEEFDKMIEDFKLLDESDDDEGNQGLEKSNFEIVGKSHKNPKKNEASVLKELGINTEMFNYSLTQFRDTQKSFQDFIKSLIEEFLMLQVNQDTLVDLVMPISEVDFNINNQQYNDYEKSDVFIAEFFNHAKQMLKQWKKQLNPQIFHFLVDQIATHLISLFKRELFHTHFTLLGALYFDKIVRKLKNFVTFLCDKPVQIAAMTELIEISQLLSSENCEELELMLNEKTDMIVQKVIKIDEIKEIMLNRVDIDKDEIKQLMKNYA